MKDFSQHKEQQHIIKFFGNRIGRFLDLGAFDGVSGSNTRALLELGWFGVCVEANPFVFQSLIKHKIGTCECVNAAILATPQLVTFHDTDSQCGTCMSGHSAGRFVSRTYTVSAISPRMLAEHFGDEFNFISLDIEGSDVDVLEALAPLTQYTELLCIEDSIPCRVFDAEYYGRLRAAAAALGFNRVIARTPDDSGSGNTLVAK